MNYDIGLNSIPSLDKDIEYGVSKQPLVIDSIVKYFNEPIEETKHKFCRYDAYSTTTKYEIKSRRCRYKTFCNDYCSSSQSSRHNGKIGFYFNFTDGLYYIVYDADLFGTFKQEVITYYRTGGSNEPVLHFMIPVEQFFLNGYGSLWVRVRVKASQVLDRPVYESFLAHRSRFDQL